MHGRMPGFTLVEVLVALAIVAIGMAALLGALSSSASATSHLRDRTFAEWIALNHLSETRLRARPPEKGRTTGKLDFAGRTWQWQQLVEPMQIEGVLRVEVSARPARPETRTGENDGAWTATVSGTYGAALAPPSGAEPDWDGNQGALQQNPPAEPAASAAPVPDAPAP